MIRALRRLTESSHGPQLSRYYTFMLAFAIAQGLTFLSVIPVVDALVNKNLGQAWRWAALLALLAACSAALFYLQQRAGYDVSFTLMRSLQHQIGDHAARLPLGWFSQARSGELAQLTSKNAEDAGTVTAHLLQPVVTAIISPLVVVMGLLWWDWRVALAGAMFVPVAVLVGWLSPKATAKVDAQLDQETAHLNEHVIDFALAQPVLRSARRQVGNYPPLDDALAHHRCTQHRGVWLVIPGMVVNTVAVQLWLVLFLATALTLTLGGHLAVPAAIGLLTVAVRFAGPLIELTEYTSAIRAAGDSMERIATMLAAPVLPEPEKPAAIADHVGVEFQNVSFGYGPDQVLDNVSFKAQPGTMTALVGPSGAGKTTILSLIARFWDVNTGSVQLGGADVRSLGSERVIAQIATVFQDVYLFDGTIRDNVKIGRPEATDAQIDQAIRLARVQEIADRLPDGLDTQVGEGGAKLSGGERQRVSVARALLKDAPVVLLDEATAAVDAENEAYLAQAFQALAKGRTVIAIAHRLETVRNADQILVLEHGKIVEAGSHDTLLAKQGRYARFWRAKEQASTWRLQQATTGSEEAVD